MIQLFATVTTLLVLTGCVSYSQPMENARGDTHVCEQTGVSKIGARIATGSHQRCRQALALLGYLPTDKIGTTGIDELATDLHGKVRIKSVVENSPADRNRIGRGDTLISIDGQRISGEKNARNLLFGTSGSTADLFVRQRDSEGLRVIVREPRN